MCKTLVWFLHLLESELGSLSTSVRLDPEYFPAELVEFDAYCLTRDVSRRPESWRRNGGMDGQLRWAVTQVQPQII